MKEIRGDRQIQCDVLMALSECRNHRKWFADFAKPYLGDHPIEIGSGLATTPGSGSRSSGSSR